MNIRWLQHCRRVDKTARAGCSNREPGKPAPVVDALLEVTAIARNLTLVTRNDKDFAGFPVKVLNPWNHG
jgi:predicted nucleic acid-binding protein